MAKKTIKYEEAIAQIDEILKRIRTNEISVDELSSEVKRATELITICRERLHKAEAEVKSIIEK
ncbi:MAG: exodeoxyribonuclease VII small subunit [Rikenellaceae bacterium]